MGPFTWVQGSKSYPSLFSEAQYQGAHWERVTRTQTDTYMSCLHCRWRGFSCHATALAPVKYFFILLKITFTLDITNCGFCFFFDSQRPVFFILLLCVKLPSAVLASHMGSGSSPGCSTSNPVKAEGYGLSACAPAPPTWETQGKLPTGALSSRCHYGHRESELADTFFLSLSQ